MLQIEFMEEFMLNEPGPNFYWRGNPADFLQIVVDLHILGEGNGYNIALHDLSYVSVIGVSKVVATSTQEGNRLVVLENDQITIDVDAQLWQGIIAKMLSISFDASFNYVEFDGLDLIEDANFLIESIK
jgi:hypothetical protein